MEEFSCAIAHTRWMWKISIAKLLFSNIYWFYFSLTQHHIRRFNFNDLMTLSFFVSPFLVVVRSALLSMFFLMPVVLGMTIFVLVTVIIVMVRSLLVRSFLAEMVVVFARLVVTFLLLAALLVAVRLMERAMALIESGLIEI